MQCKIITGTRKNAEEQLNKLLSNEPEIITMDTVVISKGVIAITIIYKSKI